MPQALFRWVVGPMALYCAAMVAALLVAVISQIGSPAEAAKLALLLPCFVYPIGFFSFMGVMIIRRQF